MNFIFTLPPQQDLWVSSLLSSRQTTKRNRWGTAWGILSLSLSLSPSRSLAPFLSQYLFQVWVLKITNEWIIVFWWLIQDLTNCLGNWWNWKGNPCTHTLHVKSFVSNCVWNINVCFGFNLWMGFITIRFWSVLLTERMLFLQSILFCHWTHCCPGIVTENRTRRLYSWFILGSGCKGVLLESG